MLVIGPDLEVSLTDVEHGSSQVQLLVELSNEDVGIKEVLIILALTVADDV